ncbi:ABC transporter permease [Puteibacter caeruleilacunae]|nr:ABC transporter permease [Puteibacter caeruleilacunae]
MIQLKSIIRMMLSEKRQHLTNIAGLTIGFIVLILISLYLNKELSFDKHVDNYQNKYRLLQQVNDEKAAIFSYIAGESIKERVPELQSFCIVSREFGQQKVDNNKFDLKNILTSDASFIDMFDLQIKEGNKTDLLNTPNTCIISESTASILLGDKSAIGESINFGSEYDATVTATYKDIPSTSHIKANIVISISTLRALQSNWRKRFFSSWGNQGSNLYIATPPGTDITTLQEKLTNSFLAACPWTQNAPKEILESMKINMQSMQDIHLQSSDVQWDTSTIKNSKRTIKSFFIVMIMILVLACFNYINLSTASSDTKQKTIGILKSLGAERVQIFFFFFKQTLTVVMIALALAVLCSWALLPYYENLLHSQMQFSLLFQFPLLGYILLTIIGVTLLSGLYPALHFSSQKSVSLIRKSASQKSTEKGLSLRPALVTLQFIVSIFLIVSLFTIKRQITLLTSKELGFSKEQLVEIQHYKNQNSYEYLAQEFMKIPAVKAVTAASNMPCEYINNENNLMVVGETQAKQPSACLVGVEPNYFQTMETKLLQGTGFKDRKSDDNNVLINNTTVKLLNLQEPIGTKLKLMGKEYTVMGVVEDVQYRTLHEPALPVLYTSNYSNHRKIAIKLHPGNHIETVNKIKAVWSSKYPDNIISLRFFDTKLQANYQTEVSQLHLFNLLVMIGVFILVLGLLGLIWFVTENRTKEIGVRKVNGAKISEILAMLNKDFVRWVVVAFILACPIAYFAMNKWLENFAYKTELSWWIFALAGVVALGIAILTVSWQSWKAATRNPVEALRYE